MGAVRALLALAAIDGSRWGMAVGPTYHWSGLPAFAFSGCCPLLTAAAAAAVAAAAAAFPLSWPSVAQFAASGQWLLLFPGRWIKQGSTVRKDVLDVRKHKLHASRFLWARLTSLTWAANSGYFWQKLLQTSLARCCDLVSA